MRIDVHAHYFPTEYIDRLIELGSAGARRARAAAPGGQLTLDQRLELMDSAGIDLQVLSVGPQLPYFTDEADGAGAARFANNIYAETCSRYPRFKAFVAAPLPHVDAALTEVERGLDELGMLGVTVGCSVAGRPLDDPSFDPFWAELDRRGTVLFLHPVGAGAGPNAADYGLTWMIGAPFEDTIAALRLVLSGFLDRYPNIRTIVPHLGGTLPFLLQRLDDAAERSRLEGVPMGIATDPSAYTRRLWYDTVNNYPPALQCSCEAFGVDRIMLGTDFPYLAGPKFVRCVTYVREALPAEQATQVLERNAEALLGLG